METRKLASDDSEKAANNADNHRFCSAGFLAKAVHFIKKLGAVLAKDVFVSNSPMSLIG